MEVNPSNSRSQSPESALESVGSVWARLRALVRSFNFATRGPVIDRLTLPGLPPQDAHAAARERRQRIVDFLQRFDGADVPTTFVEIPSESLRDTHRQQEFARGDPGRYGHAAHLRWQLNAGDQYLLAERVADAIQLVGMEHKTTVFLESISTRRKLGEVGQEFPWRVVVATAQPEVLSHRLAPFSEWLAIKVGFTETTDSRLLGRCTVGNDGLDGVVAGQISDNGRSYGITCRHVLSETCGSLHWPQIVRTSSAGYPVTSPDAALIRTGSGCFGMVPDQLSDVLPVTDADVSRLISRRVPVKKTPSPTIGTVEAEVTAFWASGDFYRGPHLLVAPEHHKRFGITWPLRPHDFSKPGDSGSWVLDPAANTWVGMVVGGYSGRMKGTYLVRADYVLQTFQAALQPQSVVLLNASLRQGTASSLNPCSY